MYKERRRKGSIPIPEPAAPPQSSVPISLTSAGLAHYPRAPALLFFFSCRATPVCYGPCSDLGEEWMSVPEPEVSSPVLIWILGNFWSLPRGVRTRLEWGHARALSSRAVAASPSLSLHLYHPYECSFGPSKSDGQTQSQRVGKSIPSLLGRIYKMPWKGT